MIYCNALTAKTYAPHGDVGEDMRTKSRLTAGFRIVNYHNAGIDYTSSDDLTYRVFSGIRNWPYYIIDNSE